MPDAPAGFKREIGLRDLILFNISSVVGIRWLAAAAHTGPGSITLWILAAILFFVPCAYAVAALARRFPEEGGIYVWTKQAFGNWHGFLCGWLYWINLVFFIPSLLLAGVGMALYTVGGQYTELAESRVYMLGASLVILWGVLYLQIIGVGIGKWTENAGGMAVYAVCIVLMTAAIAIGYKYGPATKFNLAPEWNLGKLNFWSQLVFAFGGLELGAAMGGEIRQPDKNLPRAAWISGASICAFYILGTISMLILIAPKDVNVITGIAQAGAAAGARLGLPWISPVLAILLTFGVAGQIGAWMSGCARLPFAIGVNRYLPASFARLHPKWRTPHVALLWQGVGCTVFLIAMQSGQTMRAGYQLLVDMSTITYFIPFLYMFAAAWKYGQKIAGGAGLFVIAAGLGFAFLPIADTGNVWLFEIKLIAGCALCILPARILFRAATVRERFLGRA